MIWNELLETKSMLEEMHFAEELFYFSNEGTHVQAELVSLHFYILHPDNSYTHFFIAKKY